MNVPIGDGADHWPWDPLAPVEVARLLASSGARWWIAGGYAIDMFVGTIDRRRHGDVDVGLLAAEQALVRARLHDWDLHCADPPGSLRPWREDEMLTEPIHDVWAREHPRSPWRLQLLLNPSYGDAWIFRRDGRIRRPLHSIVDHYEGIPYLVPEIQLLFKSKAPTPEDEDDLGAALPLLDTTRRTWLREALSLCAPGHAWLRLL